MKCPTQNLYLSDLETRGPGVGVLTENNPDIHQNITIITFIPVILVMAFLVSVFAVSRRENLYEFNNSLSNIVKTDTLRKKE